MWWILKLNNALETLGISQNVLKIEHIEAHLVLEKRGILTPEEAALWIVSYLPLEYQLNVDSALTIWRQQDKVSYLKEDVCEAMSRLGYTAFP